MGFLGWLGLSFIILKLLNFIDWSWWLVLLPIYVIPVLFLFLLTLSKVIK